MACRPAMSFTAAARTRFQSYLVQGVKRWTIPSGALPRGKVRSTFAHRTVVFVPRMVLRVQGG